MRYKENWALESYEQGLITAEDAATTFGRVLGYPHLASIEVYGDDPAALQSAMKEHGYTGNDTPICDSYLTPIHFAKCAIFASVEVNMIGPLSQHEAVTVITGELILTRPAD